MIDRDLPALDEKGLAPCPFCGSGANVVEGDRTFFVQCCGAECYAAVGENYDHAAYPDHIYATAEAAISAWNRRASSAPVSEGEASPGLVTWHSTDEECPSPDVGISIKLDARHELWAGEITRRRWEETEGAASLGSDMGWWLILYCDGQATVLGKLIDAEQGRDLVEVLAPALTAASAIRAPQGVVEQVKNQLVLLHSLANDTTEANWGDKRLYILQTCVRMGDELAALEAALATPAPSSGEAEPQDRKWFDPECGANGCQSLVWKARYESAVTGRREFRQAYRDARHPSPSGVNAEAIIQLVERFGQARINERDANRDNWQERAAVSEKLRNEIRSALQAQAAASGAGE